jgi:hypothetical protein
MYRSLWARLMVLPAVVSIAAYALRGSHAERPASASAPPPTT